MLTISIGYSKPKLPNKAPDYTGAMFFLCAIQAPSSYLRQQFFDGPYDIRLCAAACNSTTEYNRRHAEGGSYTPCIYPLLHPTISCFGLDWTSPCFFSFPKSIHFSQNYLNGYVLSRNGCLGEGTNRSLYSQAWNKMLRYQLWTGSRQR